MQAALAVVALLLAAAEPPKRFDLVCTGTATVKTLDTFSSAAPTTAPFSERIRVDVPALTFCDGACTSRESVAYVRPDVLQLRDDRGPEGEVEWVDRTSGEFKHLVVSATAGTSRESDGRCSVQPFSGFPHALF